MRARDDPEPPKGAREDLADLLTRRVGRRTGPNRGIDMRSAFRRGPIRDLGVGGSRSPHAGARSPRHDSDERGVGRSTNAEGERRTRHNRPVRATFGRPGLRGRPLDRWGAHPAHPRLPPRRRGRHPRGLLGRGPPGRVGRAPARDACRGPPREWEREGSERQARTGTSGGSSTAARTCSWRSRTTSSTRGIHATSHRSAGASPNDGASARRDGEAPLPPRTTRRRPLGRGRGASAAKRVAGDAKER